MFIGNLDQLNCHQGDQGQAGFYQFTQTAANRGGEKMRELSPKSSGLSADQASR